MIRYSTDLSYYLLLRLVDWHMDINELSDDNRTKMHLSKPNMSG